MITDRLRSLIRERDALVKRLAEKENEFMGIAKGCAFHQHNMINGQDRSKCDHTEQQRVYCSTTTCPLACQK